MQRIIETKVFKNGNSLAVRIPKSFGLHVQRVFIHQADNGDLVISMQSPPNKWNNFLTLLNKNRDELRLFDLDRDTRLPEERNLF